MHRILCIHGIGKHGNDWVTEVDDLDQSFDALFREKWKKYSALKGKFDDVVKLHSIHFDDEIEKIFQSWATEAKKLKDGLATSPLLAGEVGWFTDAIDKAAESKDQSDWQFTHLLDVLMFVGSPSIQDRIITYVGNQILKLVVANPNDNFSVIGHSMGTAVAHKVIQALFNEGVVTANGKRQSLKGHFSFQTVCMIANTSYSLSRDRANHYSGIVRPSLTVGQGCCTCWLNANHRLDPVGQFMKFDIRKNPQWLDAKVSTRKLHWDEPLSRISSAAIHSINHYFRDPSFHIPFFELTFGVDISDKQQSKAIEEFEASTPEGEFKTLKSHLEQLDVTNTDSFRVFFESLKSFQKLVGQF